MKHAHLLRHPALPKPDFAPIARVLGEGMPELMPGPRGRQRLSLALAQRFGENYRTNQGAQAVMKHFDDETEKVSSWLKLKGVSHG